MLSAVPASAQKVDPYASDPVDLIAYRDETRIYSSGADLWEVWVCEVPNGSIGVTPSGVTTTLESTVRPYFESISGGAYSPRFQVGGS